MTFQRIVVSVFAMAISILFTQSCKDMGEQPAEALLRASPSSVTLAPGGTVTVTISGGNPPYRIAQAPSAAVATASITNNANRTGSVFIQASTALVTSRDSVVIQDTDPSENSDNPTPEKQEITIQILVNPAAGTVFFGTQVQPIFSNSCAVPSCHVSGGSGPMTLTTGTSLGNLLDRDMLNGACGGKRVVASNAAASGLIKKLEGNCGNRMPLGSPNPLPAAQIALMRDWINQGAQNN